MHSCLHGEKSSMCNNKKWQTRQQSVWLRKTKPHICLLCVCVCVCVCVNVGVYCADRERRAFPPQHPPFFHGSHCWWLTLSLSPDVAAAVSRLTSAWLLPPLCLASHCPLHVLLILVPGGDGEGGGASSSLISVTMRIFSVQKCPVCERVPGCHKQASKCTNA